MHGFASTFFLYFNQDMHTILQLEKSLSPKIRMCLPAMGSLGSSKASIVDCTKAIVRCKNGQHWQQALTLLAEAERYLLTPNVITFNAIISVCERAAQWEVALILLEEVEGRDLQSDLVTYNAAISACGKAAEWQQALGLLNLVGSQTGLRPDTITCNSAISACEKAAKWQQALSILDEVDAWTKRLACDNCDKPGLWATPWDHKKYQGHSCHNYLQVILCVWRALIFYPSESSLQIQSRTFSDFSIWINIPISLFGGPNPNPNIDIVRWRRSLCRWMSSPTMPSFRHAVKQGNGRKPFMCWVRCGIVIIELTKHDFRFRVFRCVWIFPKWIVLDCSNSKSLEFISLLEFLSSLKWFTLEPND